MRRLTVLTLSVLLTLGLTPLVPPGARPVAAEGSACFVETGVCAQNAFLAFWQTHGATEILGLPVTQPFVDGRGLIVQFFERAILEWHRDNRPEFQVLLTRLGDDRLGNRPGRTAPPVPCGASCALFGETNHTLRGVFLNYWQANGGLPVFGFPLTEEFQEVNPSDGRVYTVQYFERNRFEYHPEHAGTRYEVLLGLLGAEALRDQPAVRGRPTARVPDYTVGVPTRLSIPAIGVVDAPVLPVGLDANGNMAAPTTAFDTTWYAPGPRPGQTGNAAISGHVDFRPNIEAVFWSMRLLKPGDEVWVTGDDGTQRRFIVQSIENYVADQAPRERIFGAAGDTNLNLVSCIGNFDPSTRSYDRRIVVYTRWDGTVR